MRRGLQIDSPRDAAPDDLGVQAFLEQFARAIRSQTSDELASLWEVPAFLIGEELAMNVEERREALEIFVAAREHYNAVGIVDTRPEIVRLDEITDRLAMVRVRWPWLDDAGREMGAECATYTLRRDPAGDWKIRVVLLHGAEAPN